MSADRCRSAFRVSGCRAKSSTRTSRPLSTAAIDVRLGEEIGRERLPNYWQLDAVLLATGANRPHRLELTGLPEGLAIEGLRFMKQYNQGHPLPVAGDVMVIGGGFTAVDCPRRTAAAGPQRSGAHHVSSRPGSNGCHGRGTPGLAGGECPGGDAGHAGFRGRSASGRLESVTFERNLLGEPDGSGKPRFISVPGSDFDRAVQHVGLRHRPDAGTGRAPRRFQACRRPRHQHHRFLRGGGFRQSAAATSSTVLPSGKQAADEVDAFLTGSRRRPVVVGIQPAALTGRPRDHDLVIPRQAHAPAGSAAAEWKKRSNSACPAVPDTSMPGAAICATTSSRSTRTSASTATGAFASLRGIASGDSARSSGMPGPAATMGGSRQGPRGGRDLHLDRQ